MREEIIPVYSISDLAKSESADDFEITLLEDCLKSARRNVLDSHRHDYFELFWVEKGGGKLSVDFDSYEVKPPMILIFSPGRVHAWKHSEDTSGLVIRFERKFFAADSQDAAELAEIPIFYTVGGDPVLYLDASENRHFEMLTKAAYREFAAENTLERTAALRSYLRLWLIYAKRLAEAKRPRHRQTPGFFLTRRFLTLVERHYRENLPLGFYADRLKVTVNHLNATVKENVGKTAGVIVRESLLVEAQRLLCYSELPISEIAFHLSFGDSSYFARFFRRYSGVSPTDFRRNSRT